MRRLASPDGVRDLLTRRAKLAGLTGLNPHRFRHTFAHDFLLAGGQERDLKRLADWSSDVMLERYGSSAADVRAGEAVTRMRRGTECDPTRREVRGHDTRRRVDGGDVPAVVGVRRVTFA